MCQKGRFGANLASTTCLDFGSNQMVVFVVTRESHGHWKMEEGGRRNEGEGKSACRDCALRP